jgi:hypothetical protein
MVRGVRQAEVVKGGWRGGIAGSSSLAGARLLLGPREGEQIEEGIIYEYGLGDAMLASLL